MRIITILLVCVAYSMATQLNKYQFEANRTFIENQKKILDLYNRIQYKNVIEEIKNHSENYNPELNANKYCNPEDVIEFVKLFNNSQLMPRGKIPTIEHDNSKEKKLLVNIFYGANDFETFYQTACWARDRVNEFNFADSLTSAVHFRHDTKYFKTPPMYEVYPFLFFNKKVLQNVTEYYLTNPNATQENPLGVTVDYTENVSQETDPEKFLAYFTEDVGLNQFNAYWNLQKPTSCNASREDTNSQGEKFLYIQQQLMSRYFINRISTNLNDLPYYNFEDELPGFSSDLMYHTGEIISGRPESMKLQDRSTGSGYLLDELFKRIREAIDLCYITTANDTKIHICNDKGINELGKLLSGDENLNQQYYGSFYKMMLQNAGNVFDPNRKLQASPGALTQYAVMLRDPLYYRLVPTMLEEFVNRILQNIEVNKQHKEDQVTSSGITINSIDSSILETYIDDFEISLNNIIAVKSEEDMKNVNVTLKQKRLNHVPFSYSLNVTSEEDVHVFVRIYIAPKRDTYGREYDLETRMLHLVEIDNFKHYLIAGDNNIPRNTSNSTFATSDAESLTTLYQNIEDALAGKKPYIVDKRYNQFGFPQRHLLPRGGTFGTVVDLVISIEQQFAPSGESKNVKNNSETESISMVDVSSTSTNFALCGNCREYSLPNANVVGSTETVLIERGFSSVVCTACKIANCCKCDLQQSLINQFCIACKGAKCCQI